MQAGALVLSRFADLSRHNYWVSSGFASIGLLQTMFIEIKEKVCASQQITCATQDPLHYACHACMHAHTYTHMPFLKPLRVK